MKIVLAFVIGLVTLVIAACSTNAPASEPTATSIPPLALVTDTQRALPIVEETQVRLATETPTDKATEPIEPATETSIALEPNTPTAIETETPTEVETETATETPTTTPTLILPPNVFFPPADGGMSISADWSEGGLRLQVFANDVSAGNNNGDGIDHVQLAIQDLHGNVIAEKNLTQAPFCYFGPEEDDCHAPQQGDADFEWGAGKPIQAGLYLIRGVAYTTSKKVLVAEQPVDITIPVNTLENLFVNIDQPGDTNVRDALSYEASVSGVGVDTTTGENIDRVEMFVVDYNGKILNSQIERNPFYCGFADTGLNQPCNVYDFAAHDSKWQNGDTIQPTEYILRAVAYAKDGRIAAQSEVIRIVQ